MSVKKEGDLSNGLPPDEQSGGGDYEPRPKHDLDRATELELIDAALLGDMQAFSEIFEGYRPDLYTLCNQRLDDPSLAEDVVQEVFLKALTRLPIFDRNKRIWPWLATIAFRMCTDLQRRRSFTHYSGDIEVSMDNGVKNGAFQGHTESALDAVIASEESAELWKSLDVLPERQRRVFLSFTLDGMSCPDIAAAEGISVGLVHVLLFRARKKMRSVHQGSRGGPLPAIVFPFNWLRWKLQQLEERVRPFLGYSEGFSAACVHAVCLGTVVAMVVATGNSAAPLNGNNAARSDEIAVLATQSLPLQAASLRTALPYIAVPAKAPVESQEPVADPAASLVDRVINPNQSATPENSCCYALTTAPNYEENHTIVAAGHYDHRSHVLFVSHDGGASWKPQISRVPLGWQDTMALSPGYPQDRRVFTLGELGLLQSDDGGEIFRTVSPLLGFSLAALPSFGSEYSTLGGGSKLLIGGKTVLEYDVATGVTQPTSLPIPTSRGVYSSITYSPGYPSNRTVFISDNWSNTILYRCKGSVCDETQFLFSGPLKLKLSPRFDQDGLAYAFTKEQLFISHDGARTLQEITFPRDRRAIEDVAVLWKTSSDPAIFVSLHDGVFLRHSVYRSLDAGRSWKGTLLEIPGFDYGSAGLTVTPTGRLLTAGKEGGIACSEDFGVTWHPRCPPEK